MAKRFTVKSCCGNKNLIIEVEKPIRKNQINIFKDSGYFVPDNFYNAGIFYVKFENLTATTSFGTTRVNVKCSGKNCEKNITAFESLLEQAVNS